MLAIQNKKTVDKNLKFGLRDAEKAKLVSLSLKAPEIKNKEIDEIIHKLEVHQIQLEMQNDELKRSLQSLEEAKDRYMDLYDFAPVGYLTISGKGAIVEANLTAATMLEVERSRLLAHGVDLFISTKDLTIWEHLLADIFHDYKKHSCELLLNRQDGSTFHALLISTRLKPCDETQLARIAISNITSHKKVEEALKESEEKLHSLLNSIDGIYIITPEGKYVDVNKALVKMLGYKNKEELMSVDTKKELYISEDERPGPDKRNRIFETRLRKKDGSIMDAEISSKVISDNGKPMYYQGIVRDITERKKAERQLKYLSFHDRLTGLYNRAYFEDELKRLDAKRYLPLSLVFGDVNSLKLVNDAFGHYEGDRLLKEVAKLVKRCFREEDITARWGGDEFSIILPNTPKPVAEKTAERIKKALGNKRFRGKMPISISFGISTKIDDSKKIKILLEEAENNMYRSKLTDKKSLFSSMVSSLERTMYEKSYETEEHAKRIRAMALKLGKTINLSESRLDELVLLASLHDIGKVAIPENIIQNKSKLTQKKWEILKKHSEIGYNIARSSPQLSYLADGILCHHEWWDGSGYPRCLKGEDIPIVSRIISIVDAHDVMLSGRPYKKALNKKEAINELQRCSGTQFDPKLVENFVLLLKNEFFGAIVNEKNIKENNFPIVALGASAGQLQQGTA